MSVLKNLVDLLYQILIGVFFTFCVYTIGTFYPNEYVINKDNNPPFSYTTETEFLSELRECVDFQNLSVPMHKRIPDSMIFAQSILESGWGRSRVAIEANNLFGIKSFDESRPHIHALENREVMYRVFEHKCESVRYYIELLNNHSAYKDFRKMRRSMLKKGQPLDSKKLILTLDKYSETDDYATRIVRIIDRIENIHK